MQDNIVFFGALVSRDGRAYLEIPEKGTLAQLAIEHLGEGPVRLTITHDDKGKEDWLLKFYWYKIIPEIGKRFRELGNDWDNEETHRQLKSLFPQHFPKGKPASIKGMSKVRFRRYVAAVRQFAAEFLCLDTPDPVSLHQFPQKEV